MRKNKLWGLNNFKTKIQPAAVKFHAQKEKF